MKNDKKKSYIIYEGACPFTTIEEFNAEDALLEAERTVERTREQYEMTESDPPRYVSWAAARAGATTYEARLDVIVPSSAR